MQDWQLLQEFVKHDSQAAFGHLVERHLNFVYSTCLRELGDSTLAEDATQVVFLLLSQKAKTLRPGTVLTGWLFQTACFVSKNARKQETRWHLRTQKAAEEMMLEGTTHRSAEDDAWPQIQPLLHDAMGTLKPGDRDAILLRHFEGRSLKETGEALGVSEEAARKRVARALEKLRDYFWKNGFTLSVAALAAMLSANAVQAAPATLATAMSAFSAGSSAAATGALGTQTLTLAESVQRAWMLVKLKTAATVVCGVSLVAVGAKQLVQTAPPEKPITVHIAKAPAKAKPASVASPEKVKIERTAPDVKPKDVKPKHVKPVDVKPIKAKIEAPEPAPIAQLPLVASRPADVKPKAAIPGNVKPKDVKPKTDIRQAETPIIKSEVSAEKVSTRDQNTPPREDIRSEDMNIKKTVVSALVGATMMAGAVAPSMAAEGDKGTVTGLLTAKSEKWIEVRADGAAEAKRYIPNWVGGLPKDGGGPDKATVEAIKKLRVPNRVKLNWAFNEHLRVLSVEMIEPAEKSGVVEGEVTAKGEGWVEVKSADGVVNRYVPNWIGGLPKDGGGPDKAAIAAIGEVKAGDKVRLEWTYSERLRVVSIKKQ